jgi:hypothetical protein
MQPDGTPRQIGDVDIFLFPLPFREQSVEALKQENAETVKMCVV